MDKLGRIAQITTDPRWWSFYLQRRVRKPSWRNTIARSLAKLKPRYVPIDQALSEAGAAALNGSGLYPLGQLLDTQKVRELVHYFRQKKVHDPYRSWAPEFLPLSDGRSPDAHVAHHDAQDILNAPYLLELANDQRVLDVVGRFLGCKPTIGYMAAWWSYATTLGPQQAENFHRDVDDWRFVKLFVYLTDVDTVNGPHKYLLYSSTKPALTQIRRFGDDEVVQAFGEEGIRTVTSRAGEAFLEDTFGIHKGQPVQSGHRLLFQVVYTMSPLPYAPRRAVMGMPEGASFDPWINRVYLQ